MWSQSRDRIIVGCGRVLTGILGGRETGSVMLMSTAWCLQVRHKYTRQVMVMKEMRHCTEEAKKSFLKEASNVQSHSQANLEWMVAWERDYTDNILPISC